MRLACKFHTMFISWYGSIKLIFIRIGFTDFQQSLQYSKKSLFASLGNVFLKNCRCDLQTAATSFTFHHYEPIGVIDFEFGFTNFLKMMLSACDQKRQSWVRGFSFDIEWNHCYSLLRHNHTTIQDQKLCFNQRCDLETTQRAQIPPKPPTASRLRWHSSHCGLHALLWSVIAHNCIFKCEKFICADNKSVLREFLFASFAKIWYLTNTDLKRAETEQRQSREPSWGKPCPIGAHWKW